MSYLRVLKNGSTQATIRIKGINLYRTFKTKKEATTWSRKTEKSIKLIPTLTDAQLTDLSDADVDSMGGTELFLRLGVDLFAVRNAQQLTIINQLDKKELLQLSAHQIKSMGGIDLFNQAGKRVRYHTFQSVCNEYMKQWKGKDFKNQIIRVNYWSGVFGHKIVTDIDIFDIRDHIKLMVVDQRTATVARKKAVLSSIFKYALGEGYIDENVVRNVVVDSDSKPRSRTLSDAEREALLEACKASSWNKLYLLVLMATVVGARKSELLNLRWIDINFKTTSTVLGTTKNGDKRTLAFPPVVMAELRAHAEIGEGYIFPSDKKPKQPKDIRKAWNSAINRAGINDDPSKERFVFHGLRHSYCSALSDSGKELSQISEMAGHRSIATTLKYIHQNDEVKQTINADLAQSFGL